MSLETLSFEELSFRVLVDQMEDSSFSGSFTGARLPHPVAFTDVSCFLLKIEWFLDHQNFPQSSQKKRGFRKAKRPHPPLELSGFPLSAPRDVSKETGSLFTFSFVVLSRQDSSWQGRVDFLDGTPGKPFSSELSLLSLLRQRAASL